MANKTSYGSITIVDITDIGEFSVTPTSNQPLTVIYNPDQGTYIPNWGSSNLTLTPVCYYAGSQVLLSDSNLSITWVKKVGVAGESALGTGETNSGGLLKVTTNQFNSSSSMLTYIVRAAYVEPTSGVTLNAEGQITFALNKQAAAIKNASITGNNVFKYNTNGTLVSASSLTLTATLNAVSLKAWQYRKSDGTWATYPNSTTAATLTVNATDNVFISDVATIRIVTSASDIYDYIQVIKLRDGAPGVSTLSAVLTNDDQMIPVTQTGAANYDSAISQIKIYKGSVDVTTQWTITAAFQNCTGTLSKTAQTNDTVHVTSIDGASASGATANVTFTCKKSGETTLVKTFSLVTVKAGVDGKNPTVYSLDASTLAMNRANSTNGKGSGLTPSSVTFSAYSTTGSASKKAYSGRFRIYENITKSQVTSDTTANYSSAQAEASCSYTPSASATSVLCILYAASGFTYELDSQMVIITKDGNKGDTGAKGEQGDGAYSVILGNFVQVLPCTSASKLSVATTVTIPFDGYQGVNKIATTVDATSAPTLLGVKPSITAATSSKSGSLVYSLPVGTAVSADTGTISIVFKMTGTTTNASGATSSVTKSVTGNFTWTKSKQAVNGVNAVLLQLNTPSGNVFNNGTGSLSMTATLYNGTTPVTSGVTFTWAKFAGGAYSNIGTGSSITIKGDTVDGYASYRCTAVYGGKNYVMYQSLIDKSDPVQAEVRSTIGTQIVNGQGVGALYCIVYRNGQELDALKTDRFLQAAPSSPAAGDFYYKLDKTQKTVTLMKYSGTAWASAGSPDLPTGTYEWSYRDKDGNVIAEPKMATTGKVIYVDGSLIDKKITVNVKVTV